ncbi:DUF58 domain-containing protein [Microbacterium sp.]|uniref:DUF58 domain-containing protein n=1 Tax=Microbacterium sp. TaxID=51671 RepID=UPI0039E5224E
MTSDQTTRTARSGDTAERTEATSIGSRRVVGAVVRAAAFWRAVRGVARAGAAWAGRTIRPAGLLALAAATAGMAGGLALGWVEWVVAGAAAAAMLLLSVPFLFGARAYEVALALAHARIVAGQSARVHVRVRNRGHRVVLPGRIDVPVGEGLVEFDVPLLRAGRDTVRTVELPPQARGVVVVGPAVTVRSDPIGLVRRERSFEQLHELYVHPRTVVLPGIGTGLIRDLDGAPTRRLVDADISFHAIREYAPGDARRQIHWKSTAKTGRLMVRQFEESLRSRTVVVLGCAEGEHASDDEFELAVGAAASLAVHAVRDARDLDVVVGADIPRVVRNRLRAIRHLPTNAPRPLLDAFCEVQRLANTMPVEEVCRLTAEADAHVSVAVIVVGSQVGLTRLRQAALAFPVDAVVLAVVCDQRAHPRTQVFGDLTVHTIGVLEDLSGLLLRGASS